METVAEMILARAGDDTRGLAAGDATWSWDEVVSEAAARAAWLVDVRRPGPLHVGILLDNVPEHVFWLLACAMTGAVAVGANPTHRGPDLGRDLAHTECQLLVTDRSHRELVKGVDLGPALGRGEPSNDSIVVADEPIYRDKLAPYVGSKAPDLASSGVGPGSLGWLIFTSGTSGAPKACRCTQGRMAFIGQVLAQMYSLGRDDCCYVAMPLFHSNALMAGWAPALASGATIALPAGGRFSASGFLPDVRRYQATYFNYVGKPLAYILATPEQPDDWDNPLRHVFGNEASPGDVERFAQRFGCQVTDNYGSTEGGVSITRTSDTPPHALGPAPAGLVILNPETGEECPPARFDESGRLVNAEDAIGEMVSKAGPGGFEGYWHNDEAEKAKLKEGWYWTGDLAYRDEAGFLYFAGRSDDWLRVDGENFAAAPVARILERHPDVVLAAVYAVPDPIVGDQVMAALQLRPGASFNGREFADFLASQPDISPKWRPRFVRICDHLPTTVTSKVLTRHLRAEGWSCSEPVWWEPTTPLPAQRRSQHTSASALITGYRLLTTNDAETLRNS